METQEKVVRTASGWPIVAALFFASLATILMLVYGYENPTIIGLGIFFAVLIVFFSVGFYTLQPNQAAALVLFGKYVGTDKASGFHWANPLYRKLKVSLRVRNFDMDPIKVNDLRGNPIEIAAVVVWRVDNTAEALFDVDNFEHYVSVQSESALRHLTMQYPYDTFAEETELSLRGSPDEVSSALQTEIQDRVAKAGVQVIEAKLSHLAYAQEIAGAMLQRQQAEAIVAARARIVEGAVGMVEMALHELEKTETVDLDEERKAAMISNLLVVLCGHADAQPVINTGTLFH